MTTQGVEELCNLFTLKHIYFKVERYQRWRTLYPILRLEKRFFLLRFDANLKNNYAWNFFRITRHKAFKMFAELQASSN